MKSILKAKIKFKTLVLSKETKEKLENYIKTIIKTDNALEAFQRALEKNYSPIPESWVKITQYAGAKMLSDHLSLNTFKKYVKIGYFRADKDGLVYREEVENFKGLMSMVDFLWEKNVFGHIKEAGKKKIVLYPSNIDVLKIPEHAQKMKALAWFLKEKWATDFIESIEL